jgi:biotin synthase
MSFTLPRSLSRTAWRSYGTVQGSPSAASIASRVPSVLVEATSATAPRTNWTPEEVNAVYHTPLNQLTYAAVRISNDETCQLTVYSPLPRASMLASH